MQSDIMLDSEAAQLFSQLGGIEEPDSSRWPQESSQDERERHLDGMRLFMIELLSAICTHIIDTHFRAGVKGDRKDSFGPILKALTDLMGIPDNGGEYLVRFRGLPNGTQISAGIDYEILCDGLTVDGAVGAAMSKRMGVQMSHLLWTLKKSFKVLAENGISTLHLTLPHDESKILQMEGELRRCLSVMAGYNHARKNNLPIRLDGPKKMISIEPVSDAAGEPDWNLTLLAAVNDLPSKKMAEFVPKVAEFTDRLADNPFFSLYDAFFAVKPFKNRLKKPLMEINNIRWLTLDKSRKIVPAAESAKQARVARAVTNRFGASPRQAAQAIQTVYGDDYSRINASHLGRRVRVATALLDSMERNPRDQNVQQEVLKNIRSRFEEIKDDVFDDLVIQKDILNIREAGEERAVGKVNGRLREIIGFYQGRAGARKKMKALTEGAIDFNEEDIRIIAKDFGIEEKGAKDLLGLMKSCFDLDGRFMRGAFERNIPLFAKYEKKVFAILWHYLKKTPRRNDRVAFLNSFKILISKMESPKSALEVLLSDALDSPEQVHFSDRNAFMLANLLIRSYSLEMATDVELTPEDVLQVTDGLDPETVCFAANRIDRDGEKFLSKIRTIHTKLLDSLTGTDPLTLPPRFLMALEREIYIFCSLVNGPMAAAVVRSALKEYGDPDANIYRLPKSRLHLDGLLQQLTVLVRGIGRMPAIHDADVLERIQSSENRFSRISGGLAPAKVARVMRWTEISRRGILTAGPNQVSMREATVGC